MDVEELEDLLVLEFLTIISERLTLRLNDDEVRERFDLVLLNKGVLGLSNDTELKSFL